MKARKYENVEFVINHSTDEMKLSLVWKKGGLYLSLSGLFLTDGNTWYELPVKELENITVVSDTPPKIRLKIPQLDIMISGERAEKLLALRHFLLPYISGDEPDSELKALLRFWGIGIKDAPILSKLLKIDEETIEKLITESKDRGYIDGNGEITPAGNRMFSDEVNMVGGEG
ncbi:MAG: hypothetical protein AYK23_00545 [Candidatus Proteinoplasmatales archaeon SG8-5]|nr:MAG: hypothetical protein AYK23_00545 [Candidatus Proteinoplasmatales archaeon SG8-5]